VSRRTLARLIAAGAGGVLLAGCAAPPAPTPAAPAPTAAPTPAAAPKPTAPAATAATKPAGAAGAEATKPTAAPTKPAAVPTAAAAQRAAPVTITYWRQQRGKGEEEGTTEYAQQFKAAAGHTVQVSYIPGGEMTAKVVSAFAAGAAPDLLLVGVGAPQYTAQNLLAEVPADLSGFVKEKAFRAEEEATLWKGKRYTVPLDASDLVLGYRVKLLQEAGVDTGKTPADWDELTQWILKATRHDASGKIVQAGFDTVFNNWETTAVIGAAGGKWWRSLDKVALSSPEVVAAYDFYRDLTWKHKATTINWMASDQYGNAFTLGKAATLLAGPWTITTMQKDAPGVEWRSFPMPPRKKGDPPGTVLGGYHVSTNAASKVLEPAWDFVRLMTTRENRILWINKTARVSPYADLGDVRFFDGDPNYEQMNKVLAVANEGHGAPPSPAEPEVAQALQVAMERAWGKGEESLKALSEEEAKVLPVFLKKNQDAGAV
jgi:multiple sugar transport system substrate-binding protein